MTAWYNVSRKREEDNMENKQELTCRTRLEEVKELVEQARKRIYADLLVKKYESDQDHWLSVFDSDLEEYVQRRVELALLEKK